MTVYSLAAIAIVATACANPVRLVRARPCPATGLPFEQPSPELLEPRPDHNFMAPVPIPASTHGKRMVVRVVVDTTGRVMSDSVTVCGIGDPIYAQRIAEEIAQMHFRPGLFHAKHVFVPMRIVYDF